MFDMGFAEMLIIGIVALIVIGPDRLPGAARAAGKWFGKIKRFVSNVKNDIDREFKTDELQKILQQQQDELQSLKEAMHEANNSVMDSQDKIQKEADQLKKDIQ